MPSSIAWKVATIAPKEWPRRAKRVEPERLREAVDILGEAFERQGCGIDAIASALAALVHIDKAHVLGQRVEVRPERRVVEARPSVQDDERRPFAQLLDMQADAVGELYAHPPAIAATIRISSSPSSGVSRPSRIRMSCRST